MKKMEVEVYFCYTCPHLLTIDGFASHHYYCQKIMKSTSENDGSNGDLVHSELKVWFDKECPYPEEVVE